MDTKKTKTADYQNLLRIIQAHTAVSGYGRLPEAETQPGNFNSIASADSDIAPA